MTGHKKRTSSQQLKFLKDAFRKNRKKLAIFLAALLVAAAIFNPRAILPARECSGKDDRFCWQHGCTVFIDDPERLEAAEAASRVAEEQCNAKNGYGGVFAWKLWRF
ncbi:MAG: hypothetical protein EPN97_04155 [Alphaproteobacteria bacterium]|nr:MAG: hypothetical protein EPN97_04155 [Alphaproteobacteria bacterium]